MVAITEKMVRSRSEHNEGDITTMEEISLHQQDITRLTGLDKMCRHLKILYLQNNLIPKIENMKRLKELEYVNFALNNITKVEGLENCESLNKLDFTVNFIDIDELQSFESLKHLYALREIHMMGNPCTDFPEWRPYLVATLPQLEIVDGEDVTPSERIKALQELPAILERLKPAVAQNRIKNKKRRDEAAAAEEREAAEKEAAEQEDMMAGREQAKSMLEQLNKGKKGGGGPIIEEIDPDDDDEGEDTDRPKIRDLATDDYDRKLDVKEKKKAEKKKAAIPTPPSIEGECALHTSAGKEQNMQMVAYLVESGKFPANLINDNGNTALHMASFHGNMETAAYLHTKDCPLDWQNKNGWTAMHNACHKRNPEMLKLLLAMGADMAIKDHAGKTAKDVTGDQACVQLITDWEQKKRQEEGGGKRDESELASPWTPEGRMKDHLEDKAQKDAEDEKVKKSRPGYVDPDAKKVETPGVFNKKGEVRQVNQGRWAFNVTDEDQDGWPLQNITVEVDFPRFLDTSAIDLDIQPTYMRAVVKEKVFQIHFPEEVLPDQAKAKRSQVTGAFKLVVPKLREVPVRRNKKTAAQLARDAKERREKKERAAAGENDSDEENSGGKKVTKGGLLDEMVKPKRSVDEEVRSITADASKTKFRQSKAFASKTTDKRKTEARATYDDDDDEVPDL